MFAVVTRFIALLQNILLLLVPCNFYLEVLSVVAVVYIADVQFAVNEISNAVDVARWRL
jgi:hypothetical protein